MGWDHMQEGGKEPPDILWTVAGRGELAHQPWCMYQGTSSLPTLQVWGLVLHSPPNLPHPQSLCGPHTACRRHGGHRDLQPVLPQHGQQHYQAGVVRWDEAVFILTGLGLRPHPHVNSSPQNWGPWGWETQDSPLLAGLFLPVFLVLLLAKCWLHRTWLAPPW
ncbi:Hypothetical predicted protein [Marmota monax]|uniref:Uncharacterized protein n=1 Tax=Marmota monax TaxID=9995 RepID=A0A5E4AYA1_MARMO|nr:Hypothetical predicted protein [Marmota monax]